MCLLFLLVFLFFEQTIFTMEDNYYVYERSETVVLNDDLYTKVGEKYLPIKILEIDYSNKECKIIYPEYTKDDFEVQDWLPFVQIYAKYMLVNKDSFKEDEAVYIRFGAKYVPAILKKIRKQNYVYRDENGEINTKERDQYIVEWQNSIGLDVEASIKEKYLYIPKKCSNVPVAQ